MKDEQKIKPDQQTIDWSYPEPRKGLKGSWDRFVGPGATIAESCIGVGATLFGAIAMLVYACLANLDWSVLQYVLAVLIAGDLVGGVAVNATSSAKRWYHRKGQGFRQHLTFVAIHIHPFIVGLLFRPMDWVFAVVFYVYLIVATVVILLLPLYVQRPVGLLLFIGAVLIGLYGFSPTPGLEWFVPVFFLKLLVAHTLREEPYRRTDAIA